MVTDEQILERLRTGHSYSQIQAEFSVSPSRISLVKQKFIIDSLNAPPPPDPVFHNAGSGLPMDGPPPPLPSPGPLQDVPGLRFIETLGSPPLPPPNLPGTQYFSNFMDQCLRELSGNDKKRFMEAMAFILDIELHELDMKKEFWDPLEKRHPDIFVWAKENSKNVYEVGAELARQRKSLYHKKSGRPRKK